MAFQLTLFSWVRGLFRGGPALPGAGLPGAGTVKRSRAKSSLIRPSRPLRSIETLPTVDARLHLLWVSVRRTYFPDRGDLDSYVVTWSRRRQRRVLASCNWHRRKVVVARELRDDAFNEWLEPLLYHEMCHAVLGRAVSKTRRGHAWHGPEFKSLERRHPQISALDSWIRSGGWHHAVRRARGVESAARRRPKISRLKSSR